MYGGFSFYGAYFYFYYYRKIYITAACKYKINEVLLFRRNYRELSFVRRKCYLELQRLLHHRGT